MGYGRGANRGLEVATGRMVLILNDDATIGPRSIQLLINALDSDSAARLAAPRMVSPQGDRLPSGRRYLPGLRAEVARIGDRIRGRRTRLAMPEYGPTHRSISCWQRASWPKRSSLSTSVGSPMPSSCMARISISAEESPPWVVTQ